MNLAKKKYNERKKGEVQNGPKKLYPRVPCRSGGVIEKHRNKRSSEAVKNACGNAVHMDKPSKARRFTAISIPPKPQGIVKFSKASKRA